MGSSLTFRDCLPLLVAQLLVTHARAWTAGTRALLSYQRARGPGFWVILRTPTLGARRLVSARVLLSIPNDTAGWRNLRKQIGPGTLDKLGDAKFRYVFVPKSDLAIAKQKLSSRSLRVEALPNPRMARS